MLHGAMINLWRRIVNQAPGCSCREAAQSNSWIPLKRAVECRFFVDNIL